MGKDQWEKQGRLSDETDQVIMVVIDPLDKLTWISIGVEAASQSLATREFNMGVLQT